MYNIENLLGFWGFFKVREIFLQEEKRPCFQSEVLDVPPPADELCTHSSFWTDNI